MMPMHIASLFFFGLSIFVFMSLLFPEYFE